MAKEVYSDIDYRKNTLLNPVIHNVSNFPANAKVGQQVFHITLLNNYSCIGGTDTTLPSAWTSTPLAKSSTLFNFGRDRSNLKTQWLRLNGGGAVSNITGHRVWKPSSIKSISVQTGSTSNSTFKIYKNGSTLLLEIVLTNSLGNQVILDDNSLIDLVVGDTLSCLMEVNSGKVKMPNLNVEIVY